MKIYLHMFCLSVKKLVGLEVSRTDIVTPIVVESEEQHLDHVGDIESMRFQRLYWQGTYIQLQDLSK
jgi:hypothetical protein